jgi:toxin ParE1/3/4
VTGKLDFLTTAEQDLLAIWQHISEHHPDSADRLLDRLRARTQILKTFPEAGAARPDVDKTARMIVEHPYVILYRIMPGLVQIVRILHGARDISSKSFGSELR